MSGTEVAYFALQVAASYAISVLTAPDVEGPRLTDLAASGSSYGQSIPLAYGTVKLPGNVIWASDLIETKHTESAKGGPEITTYKYSQHLDVLVCAGPVTGVRRIWANGRLVFDISTTNTGAIADPAFGGFIQTAIARVVSSLATVGSGIRVYTGDETQTADSLLEAYLGAGNVPGMRGYCHVVFENMQLADYGNRTPSLEFEVVGSGSFSRALPTLITSTAVFNAFVDERAHMLIWASMDHNTISCYDIATATVTRTISTSGMVWIEPGDPATHTLWVCRSSTFDILDIDTGEIVGTAAYSGFASSNAMRWNAYDSSFLAVYGGNLLRYTEGAGSVWSATTIATVTGITYHWQCMETTPSGMTVLYSDYDRKLVVLDGGYSVVLEYAVAGAGGSYSIFKMSTYDPVRNRVYICSSSGSTIIVVDLNQTIPTVTEVTVDGTANFWPVYHKQSDVLVITGNGAHPAVYVRDPESLATALDSFADVVGFWPVPYLDGWPVEIPGLQDYVFHVGQGSGIDEFQFGQRLSANQVQLSAVVSDLCTRAGLATSDIDVTALTDMVDGYTTA